MLGTNDIKDIYNLSAEDIARHLEETITLIQDKKIGLEKIPNVLVVWPPPIIIPVTNDLDPRLARGVELFKVLPRLYEEVAKKYDCLFLNAGDHMTSSKIDGYHFDSASHVKLAQSLKNIIEQAVL